MNKTKPIITILLTLLLLNACGTIAEGLGGTKKKVSSEFLVEKKTALILPPSFGELPEPGVKMDENTSLIKKDSSSIENIINQSSSIEKSKNNNNFNSSVDQFIIDKINE